MDIGLTSSPFDPNSFLIRRRKHNTINEFPKRLNRKDFIILELPAPAAIVAFANNKIMSVNSPVS